MPDGDYAVRAGFTSWLRCSADNVEAFLRQKMLDAELEPLDPHKAIDVQALIRRARAKSRTSGNIVRL